MSRFTLSGRSRHEVEIRRSRFLAQAAPVTSAEAGLAFFDEVADPAATHNCWAWRIGQNYRFSDDGEPASSAGKPILAAIDGQELDQVMVVVTRWFGGTKLGVGGLIRAYGGTAAQCLRLAPREAIVDFLRARLACSFEHSGSVHQLLEAHQARKIAENWTAEGAVLELELPEAHYPSLAESLRDATRGAAKLVRISDNGELPAA